MKDLTTIVAIITSIVAIISALIAGLYNFITKTNTGLQFWLWVKDKCVRLGAFVWRRRTLVIVSMIIVSLAVVVFGRRTYQFCCSPPPKSITGNIYYLPCENSLGRDPVPNVTVFISERRDLKSEPTGPDGMFLIQNIPIDFQPSHLIARHGGQDFPLTYTVGGDYAIIKRPCPEPRDIREINTAWTRASAGECLTETARAANVKRYLLDTSLPGGQGKGEAVLTVELLEAVDAMILNAFVRSPSQQFYRNETVPNQDRSRAHTWAFMLPKNGLRIKLDICLGSNDSAEGLSKERMHTYYELR